jgi:hypothetical protein
VLVGVFVCCNSFLCFAVLQQACSLVIIHCVSVHGLCMFVLACSVRGVESVHPQISASVWMCTDVSWMSLAGGCA